MLHRRTEPRSALACGLIALALGCSFFSSVSWAQKASPATRAASPVAAAKAHLDKGELDAAEETLWKLLGNEPSNEQGLTLLGIIRGRQERYAEAEALFRRVLQINPKSMVATRNLAGALLAQDKAEEAIQQYIQAIGQNPQDSDLKIDVARLELGRGDFAGALAMLDRIAPSRFPSASVPLKAASLVGVGRKADAVALIPRAQGSPLVALELASVFVEAQEPEAALKALSLVNPVPKGAGAKVSYLKGRALQQQGNGAAAMASFRQAQAADPNSSEALMAMAEAQAAEGKHAESVSTLQKARDLNPESPDVLRHFIVEAMHAGENGQALLAAQDLQRKSSELDDRFLIASVMLQQKQFVTASHILEDYVGQRPEDAKAYLGLGMAYLSLLRYPDARLALERSLKLKPDLAESEFQLGLLAAQEGKRPEAMQRWKRAVELQPRHAQALFSLGTVYLETGELADAESAFSRSLEADPGNMKAEYNLGLVLNKLGKPDEAKQHLERYRKMQEEEHATNGNPRAGEQR
ncbi:MAG TPA: tetratricopeptide repeat protein [Terriglobales bacterium]|nr:tetratricopeptide repeat protein [Terriglobales bacterium]